MGYKLDKRKTDRKRFPGPAGEKSAALNTQLPNSLIMRVREDSEAEREADRLSRDVTSRTPDDLMAEMGSRLGADFSDVRFHSDTLSMNRSKALGARAWAQGSDIYFGRGGFDPKVAAHELVHTVQQGAVRGDTVQSAPGGAVQLFSGEDDNAVHRRLAPANAGNLELMTEQKNSSEFGQRVFRDLKNPVKKLAQQSGSRIRDVNEDSGVVFIANMGERDYSGKAILRDIATRTVINKDEMYDRVDEYEGFLDYMQNRTNKVGLEAASMQAGILDGQPKYDHNNDKNINKRAYEMSEQELSNNTFNPTNDTEIAEVLKKIDAARSAKEAYLAFKGYTENKEYTREEIRNSQDVINFAQQPIPTIHNEQGVPTEVDPIVAGRQQKINDDLSAKIAAAKQKVNDAKKKGKNSKKGSQEWDSAKAEYESAKTELMEAQAEQQQNAKKITYRYKQGAPVNVPLLKAKLKNMVRQVRDYPELKHKIGALNIQWNQSLGAFREEGTASSVMSVVTTAGAAEKAMINYDAYIDRNSPEAAEERDESNQILAESIGNLNKVGNHELGHVLESTLNTEEEQQTRGEASNDILQSVLPKVMSPQEQTRVQYNRQDGKNRFGKDIYQGQIDTTSPIFEEKQMSSHYGQTMPKEWFAEAFHDVYTKGADAKPTSIEIVKEYERRQTAQQAGKFRKKERSWFTNLGRRISKWFNFGRRHGEPEPQPAVPEPAAALPQIGQANAVPDPDEDPFDHYRDNFLGNSLLSDPQKKRSDEDQFSHYYDNFLGNPGTGEALKKKKLKKKKKK